MNFSYKDTAPLSANRIESLFKFLSPYLKHLQDVSYENYYNNPESSINLPFDEKMLRRVLELKDKKVSPKLKYIIDIGIGGSNLGTKAIYNAVRGYADILEPNRFPKIIFADTVNPIFIQKLQKFLDEIDDTNEVLINCVSKSGTTTETIANLELLVRYVKNFKQRLVVTTDEDSKLWKVAERENIECLSIPKPVGGRFSVFSSVGLFPLAAAKINIVDLLSGAMHARQQGLLDDVSENKALISAVLAYDNYKRGKTILDTFYFHPELEDLGKWYRQLVGESLGKKRIGLTPTVSIGSNDLHSMAQLYLGGPKDKYFTFVRAIQLLNSPRISSTLPLPTTIPEIKERSAIEIMNAIYAGTKVSYKNAKVPFSEIVFEGINEQELGDFMQFKMLEVMYIAKLLGVNAFNQPDVEDYKNETKVFLMSK